MEYMSIVIGTWVVGMTVYSILNISIFKNKGTHRCNCRNELVKLKKTEKKLNDSSKNFFD